MSENVKYDIAIVSTQPGEQLVFDLSEPGQLGALCKELRLRVALCSRPTQLTCIHNGRTVTRDAARFIGY